MTAVGGPLSALGRSLAPRPHPFATDPYLQGPNAPRSDERTLIDLPVRGTIPAELDGVYLRNGPNPQFEPLAYNFPFDGDGMVHAVGLHEEAARSYRNRWVTTAGLRAERRCRPGRVRQRPAAVSRQQTARRQRWRPEPGQECGQHQRHWFRQPHPRALRSGVALTNSTRSLQTLGNVRLRRPADHDDDGASKCDPADGSLHFLPLRGGRGRNAFIMLPTATGTIVRETGDRARCDDDRARLSAHANDRFILRGSAAHLRSGKRSCAANRPFDTSRNAEPRSSSSTAATTPSRRSA